MDNRAPSSPNAGLLEDQAAAWVLRASAGLTLDEEQELADWLAADPRHAASFAEHQRAWDMFTPLAGRSFAPRPAASRKRWLGALCAVAAVAALGLFLWRQAVPPQSAQPSEVAAALPALCERHTLPDGTVVELNRGAEMSHDFTAAERFIELRRGEANFIVAKDAARPFVVAAGAVRVRAVGTAFNVRYAAADVEIVVTEGRVKVTAPGAGAETLPILEAGQALRVPLADPAAAPGLTTLTAEELESRLAWQPRLLSFDDARLGEIVAEFNRRNPVPLTIADPGLAALRLTVSFRSDNVEGFVRLLEAHYGVRATPQGAGEIRLQPR